MPDQEYETAADALTAQADEANKAAADARDENAPQPETEEEYAARIEAVRATSIFSPTLPEPNTVANADLVDTTTPTDAPAEAPAEPVADPAAEPVVPESTSPAAEPVTVAPEEPVEEQAVVGPEGEVVEAPTTEPDEENADNPDAAPETNENV